MTLLVVVFWVGAWEAAVLITGASSAHESGLRMLAMTLSPLRAIDAAARPNLDTGRWWNDITLGFTLAGLLLVGLLNIVAIWRVRIWNPSREVRRGQHAHESGDTSIWGAHHDLAQQ